MATYLFSYRVPRTPLREALDQLDDAAREARLAAWVAWFEGMGPSLVARGNPVADALPVGECGPDTRVGGYSIISADSIDEAVALANDCPGIVWGGGVEVGTLLEMESVILATDSHVEARR